MGSNELVAGRCRDVSVGGMYVETSQPVHFGAALVVRVSVPGQKTPLAIPAVVRWVRQGQGMGLQFGLMGARETHAITELARHASATRS